MGAVSEAIARSARSFGAKIRTNARVARLDVRGGRVRGAVLDNGEEFSAPLVVTTLHPKTAFLRAYSTHRAAGRLRQRHRALEDPQRRGEDQPGAGRAAQLHRRPERRTGRASHGFGGDGADDGVHRGRVPGRPGGQAGADALQRRRHPDHIGQDTESRWHTHHVAVHPVGARGVGDEPHTEELDAYADRLIDLYDQVAPGFKSVDHAPRHRRPVRDGAGVRVDRRQHLPRRAVAGAAVPHATRARLRRLPHARSPGCTTAARPRTPAAACAAFPGWQAARAALADQKRGAASACSRKR